jgi:hypothetical protein
VTGTLPTANGGTNLTSFTSGGVVYASSTSALATGSALYFDGTNLGVGTTSPYSNAAFSTLTLGGSSSSKTGLIALATSAGTDSAHIDVFNTQLRVSTNGTTNPIVFYTGGGVSEAVRIDSSQNVGIGTTSPNILTWNRALTTNTASGNVAYELAIAGAAQAYFGADASNIYLAGYANKPLFIRTNNANAITIDTSQNVGIGTSSPSGKLDIAIADNGNIDIRQLAANSTGFLNWVDSDADRAGRISYDHSNNSMRFATSSTERARIDSSGNLLVGDTTQVASERLNVTAGNATGIMVKNTGGATYSPIYSWNATTTGDGYFAAFFTEASPTIRGSIQYNRTAGLTAYNTTSDYRAKDISGLIENSGALIDSVPVYMGTMKGATQERPMFIAHEVPAYARTGEKDAVDENGNPKYQQMDASALIPVMWAEIQSLRQRLSAANL